MGFGCLGFFGCFEFCCSFVVVVESFLGGRGLEGIFLGGGVCF